MRNQAQQRVVSQDKRHPSLMDTADSYSTMQDVMNRRIYIEASQWGKADDLNRRVHGDCVTLVRIAMSEVTGRKVRGQANCA
jgi:hypothetical protein